MIGSIGIYYGRKVRTLLDSSIEEGVFDEFRSQFGLATTSHHTNMIGIYYARRRYGIFPYGTVSKYSMS